MWINNSGKYSDCKKLVNSIDKNTSYDKLINDQDKRFPCELRLKVLNLKNDSLRILLVTKYDKKVWETYTKHWKSFLFDSSLDIGSLFCLICLFYLDLI